MEASEGVNEIYNEASKYLKKNIYHNIPKNISPTFVVKQRKYREIILCHLEKVFPFENEKEKQIKKIHISKLNAEKTVNDFLEKIINKLFLNSSLNFIKTQMNNSVILINKINSVYDLIINDIFAYNKDFLYFINNIHKSTLYTESKLYKLHQKYKKIYEKKIKNTEQSNNLYPFIIEYNKAILEKNQLKLKEKLLLLNKKNDNWKELKSWN